jgi:hypothetical protein
MRTLRNIYLPIIFILVIIFPPILDSIIPSPTFEGYLKKMYNPQFTYCIAIYPTVVSGQLVVQKGYVLFPNVFSDPTVYLLKPTEDGKISSLAMKYGPIVMLIADIIIIVYLFRWIKSKDDSEEENLETNEEQK